jgi:hypothetical protein
VDALFLFLNFALAEFTQPWNKLAHYRIINDLNLLMLFVHP